MQQVLEQVLAQGYVHLRGIVGDTLEFTESLGEVFRPLQDESPIVTMKIEGNDLVANPYASCRTPELSLHTDYATFPVPPRFTITHCIDPDPEFPRKGLSIVVFIAPVIEHLRTHAPSLLRVLRTGEFPFRRNEEHALYHATTPTYPILDGEDRVRFDRTLIVPHLERSERPDRAALIDAVIHFERLCAERGERVEIALDRQEALIIDNRRVLHSRSECTMRHDEGRTVSREVNLAFLV